MYLEPFCKFSNTGQKYQDRSVVLAQCVCFQLDTSIGIAMDDSIYIVKLIS